RPRDRSTADLGGSAVLRDDERDPSVRDGGVALEGVARLAGRDGFHAVGDRDGGLGLVLKGEQQESDGEEIHASPVVPIPLTLGNDTPGGNVSPTILGGRRSRLLAPGPAPE